MRTAMTLAALLLCAFAAPAERRINFEDDEVGKLPRFFTPAVSGDAKEGKWAIEEARDAPSGKKVLAQRDAEGAEDRYALCVYDSRRAPAADVEVRVNCVGGKTAQSGGVVVRYINRNNYYVARANAQGGNVRLYAVVQGKATQIAGQPVSVAANQWHKLRVIASGRRFEVHFNDIRLFDTVDDAHRDPGQVAVWTEADSATLFDDFIIKPVEK